MIWKCNYFPCLFLLLLDYLEAHPRADLEPQFLKGTETNVTVKEGTDALLPCVVENLGFYRVAWIRVESQTILTIHSHVITRNYRISLSHEDHQHWSLRITRAQESDGGQYMCQINTVPMRKKIIFLDVLVPPKFLERAENVELLAREGTNVTLSCRAKGNPIPTVTWAREDGRQIGPPLETEVKGQYLHILKVSRLHMGAYLCSASSPVAPPVTRGMMLQVLFPPMIWIPNQLSFASTGDTVSLDCYTEAFPMSINYWTKEDSCMIVPNDKYVITLLDNVYKVSMKLLIYDIQPEDFGTYKCVARNSLGSTEGVIRIHETYRPISNKKLHSKDRNGVQQETLTFKGKYEEAVLKADLGFKHIKNKSSKHRIQPKSSRAERKHMADYLSSSKWSDNCTSFLEVVVMSVIVTQLTARWMK